MLVLHRVQPELEPWRGSTIKKLSSLLKAKFEKSIYICIISDC